jgi:hypothetical protein
MAEQQDDSTRLGEPIHSYLSLRLELSDFDIVLNLEMQNLKQSLRVLKITY